MADIRERRGKKKVTWEVQVRVRGHKPLTRTFARKTDAKNWWSQIRAKLTQGEVVTNEAHRHTLAEAIDRFLKQRPDLSADVRSALKWWRREHGERRLSAITGPWLQEIRDGLLGEPQRNDRDGKEYRRGAGVANRRLTYLAAVLGRGNRRKPGGAMAWGWIRSNPAAEVTKVPEPPGRTRFLDDDEREALQKACAAAGDEPLLPMVLCALSSGARAGELLSLRWKDVDLKQGTAVIHTSKTGAGRTLHFVGRALTKLRDFAAGRDARPDARVFASAPDGLYPFQYGEPFRQAVKAAGITDFRFHDLRHCTASYLAQSGASLLEIGYVLGHRSQQTTQRYSHLTRGHSEQLVSRVLGEKLA